MFYKKKMHDFDPFDLLEHIHVWRQRNYDVAVQTFISFLLGLSYKKDENVSAVGCKQSL